MTDGNIEEKKSLQLAKLFPNMMTLLGLCAGLSAMRWSLDGRWELAISLIIIAAMIDAMDGRLARRLNATSSFGAQLDSLADFINFGVAPAFILYKWGTHEIKGIGWAVALFFAICAAIRLARFNSDLESDESRPEWTAKFFIGMPSPAGALVGLGPIFYTLAFKDSMPQFYAIFEFFTLPAVVCIYMALIAMFMASRIPTFSFKKISIKNEYASPILAAAGILFVSFMTEPWITIFVVGVIYLLTIPMGIILYYKYANNNDTIAKRQ